MLAIAGTIAPIFLLIMAGYVFKYTGFPGDGFWRPAEKLAYYVLLPVLIVRNLAIADLSVFPVGRIGIIIVGIAVSMTVVVMALRPLMRIDGPAFSSVLQGTIRINSYLGFALAEALFGTQGLVLSALFVALMMPVVNVICIGALAAFAHAGKPNFRSVPKQIAQNPIILACAIGWILNTTALPIPDVLMSVMTIFDRAALPVALLCVGAGLVIKIGRTRTLALCATAFLKLICMPAVASALAFYLGVGGVPFVVIMIFAAAPSSPASYVLARQLGGDAPLMAATLTAETIIAAVTLPPILAWATRVGGI